VCPNIYLQKTNVVKSDVFKNNNLFIINLKEDNTPSSNHFLKKKDNR